jgi:hypothetical protein
MAEGVREEAKRRRAGAREQRRPRASQAFEALDEAAGAGDKDGTDPMASAKRAARTAAVAAIAGGLAGAAKALLERRERSRGDQPEDDRARSEPEQAQPPPESPMSEEPQADEQPEPQDEGHDQPAAEERPSREPEDRLSREPEGRPRREPDDDEPEHGASSSDVAAVVERARSHVANVVGKDPESVSGISHANGSWSVIIEVVEVHRVPESTDVLGSYEVVLDEGGDLVRIEPRGRYRRSQVEEER